MCVRHVAMPPSSSHLRHMSNMDDDRVPFSDEAMVRGYHAYKDISAAVHGEELPCEKEAANWVDAFAVAVMKDGMVVGHISKDLLRLLFVPTSRQIDCMSCSGIKTLLSRPNTGRTRSPMRVDF